MAAVADRRVCASLGCKTLLRASQSDLICDPCRVTKQEERAREVAREQGIECRIEGCDELATKGVGSKSHRWRNLCDRHYLIEIEKARAAAQTVESERRDGERPPRVKGNGVPFGTRLADPPLDPDGPYDANGNLKPTRPLEPEKPERVEIAGVRTALSERMVRVAKQLDVIDAQIKLLRDSAEPLMVEWETLIHEVFSLPELGSGPLDLAQGVRDSEDPTERRSEA